MCRKQKFSECPKKPRRQVLENIKNTSGKTCLIVTHRPAALESGAIDAIAAGMSPTAERAAQIDFTDTYYESNLVVIIRK